MVKILDIIAFSIIMLSFVLFFALIGFAAENKKAKRKKKREFPNFKDNKELLKEIKND